MNLNISVYHNVTHRKAAAPLCSRHARWPHSAHGPLVPLASPGSRRSRGAGGTQAASWHSLVRGLLAQEAAQTQGPGLNLYCLPRGLRLLGSLLQLDLVSEPVWPSPPPTLQYFTFNSKAWQVQRFLWNKKLFCKNCLSLKNKSW